VTATILTGGLVVVLAAIFVGCIAASNYEQAKLKNPTQCAVEYFNNFDFDLERPKISEERHSKCLVNFGFLRRRTTKPETPVILDTLDSNQVLVIE
jgi:hypothetical protein